MKKYIYGISGIVLIVLVTAFVIFIKTEQTPHLVIYGPIKVADGLGQQSMNVIRALKKDVSIACVPTREILEKIPKDIRPFIKQKADRKAKVHLFEEALWYPYSPVWFTKYIAKMPESGLKIAYSMFETSKIPQEWVLILNCYFDAIAVPDKFLIDVYQKSGVQIPIFEVPLGINLERFLNEPLKVKKNRAITTFANFSTCTDRKNHLTLIRAFAKAFGNRDDVLLKINSRESDPPLKTLVEYEIKNLGLDNVVFTSFILNDENYLRFFQTIDCYVSCSKGEGFSIQPREAMALGIPVIVTDNTGQTTICESGLVKSVLSVLKEPAYIHCFDKIPYGNFVNCEIDELSAALLDMHNNYDDYLKKGTLARQWVKQYRFDNVREIYLNLVKPKQLLFGSENKITKDYLMTNSKGLYKKYKQILGES